MKKVITAFMLMVIPLGCGSENKSQPEPQVNETCRLFWERFVEANRAWLDPAPPSLAYEVICQQHTTISEPGKPEWKHRRTIRVRCAPDRCLQWSLFKLKSADPSPEKPDREDRYRNGKGGTLFNPPRKPDDLREDEWLAGRTGAGFCTSLHLFAWWGLPGSAMILDNGGKTIQISARDIRSPHVVGQWRKDHFVRTAYGIHPLAFNGFTTIHPDSVMVEIDRETLRPVRLIETSRDGDIEETLAETIFEEPWLEIDGRPVPGRVQCSLFEHDQVILFRFMVRDGAWVAEEVLVQGKVQSLHSKGTLRHFTTGKIDPSAFEYPMDVELPDHSETDLGPGERIVTFDTHDELTLEGKLSLPPDAGAPVPVVFFMHGSGPFSFDRPLEYPDPDTGEIKVYCYFDFYARELSRRGIGFFRMNKRGCAVVKDKPFERVNRRIFSRATPAVLLRDYESALEALQREEGVDEGRILLLGLSEGTILAPRLAYRSPEGIAALALCGYAQDGFHDVLVWQNMVGPWRNIARIFDENSDGKVTKDEHREVCNRAPIGYRQGFASFWTFSRFDRDGDGEITPEDRELEDNLETLLDAVEERNDDYLWDHLLNLSSAYFLEEWDTGPHHEDLMKLAVPVRIFHGEHDGACRVEGAIEAAASVEDEGFTHVSLRTYPKTDHDLNWLVFLKTGEVPPAFLDVFDFAEQHLLENREED